jgi:hypothetical protein
MGIGCVNMTEQLQRIGRNRCSMELTQGVAFEILIG